MFCLKCGYKIPSGAAFCPNCGAKVQAEEPVHPTTVPSGAAAKTDPTPPASDTADQTETVPPVSETSAQHETMPPSDTAVPPVIPQPVPDNPQPLGNPLAALVGKHTEYYLAEFKKIDAVQKPRFNWAAFLLGPMMCFYRRSGELFKKYFLFIYVALAVSSLILMVGMSSFNGPAAAIGAVLALIACVWGLVNTIRFGRNFNRDYYAHCKQQLAKPASERKGGTSIKNIVLFLLALTGVEIVLSVVGSLLAVLMLSAMLNSAWEDEGSYSEDTYTESSSYYDEAALFAEEEPSYTEDASSSEAFVSEYNLPVGTYQMWIGYGGTTASIRLWEEPSDPENPWYCDVIIWDGIDTIVDDYFGPAYVSDELQTIVCGDYTFGIGYDGSVLVDDSMSDVPYNVIYYSGDTSMETGLNALIDISDELTPVTKDAVDVYSEFYGLDRTIIHMPMY